MGRGQSLGQNEVGEDIDVRLRRVLRYDSVKGDLVCILKDGNILNKVWGIGVGGWKGYLVT